VGSGGAGGCGFMRERGGWRKEMELTGGTELAEKEGGRGGVAAGWASPGRGRGRR